MNTHIQIRNVSNELHRKLKIRAAQSDMTMTDYVKKLIEADAAKPTLAVMAERMRNLPPVDISVEEIVHGIREDRDSR